MDPWVWGKGSMLEGLPNINHFIYPSGIYNPVLEGRSTNYDKLIYEGNESGFERTTTMFPELQTAK